MSRWSRQAVDRQGRAGQARESCWGDAGVQGRGRKGPMACEDSWQSCTQLQWRLSGESAARDQTPRDSEKRSWSWIPESERGGRMAALLT